jgi:hypothetical protein
MDGVLNCATKSGFELNTTSDGAKYRSTLMDYSCFITTNNDYVGINLVSGTTVYLSSENDTSELSATGQTFIKYDGNSITYKEFVVIGCIWNNVGIFRSGFDFTLKRDADIIFLNNTGDEDKLPHAKFTALDNLSGVTLTTTYQRLPFTTDTSYMVKFGYDISTNVLTFLPTHKKSVMMWISGAVTAVSQPVNMGVAVSKNGETGVTYGHISLYLDQNTPRQFNFSTNVYLEDVVENDTFQIMCNCSTETEPVVLQDVNWLILSQ